MREILFRGKRTDNGKWIEGSLFLPDKPDTPTQICIGTNVVRISYDVDPSTIGQYTGLTDKNGTKIFEGDIVTTKFNERNKPYATIYDEELAAFIGRDKNNFNFTTLGCIDNSLIEIIGNIHDNPELLEG